MHLKLPQGDYSTVDWDFQYLFYDPLDNDPCCSNDPPCNDSYSVIDRLCRDQLLLIYPLDLGYIGEPHLKKNNGINFREKNKDISIIFHSRLEYRCKSVIELFKGKSIEITITYHHVYNTFTVLSFMFIIRSQSFHSCL